jgi:hypothetical protein
VREYVGLTTMQTRISSAFILLGTLLFAACTGSGRGGSGSRDAGGSIGGSGPGTGGSSGTGGASGGRTSGTGGGGGGGGAGGGGGSSGSGACTVSGADILTNDAHQLSGLSFGGDRLAFLSSDLDLSVAPTIDTVLTDGTGRTTIHTPTGQRRVSGLLTRGANVYFLEMNEDPAVPMLELFSVPVVGSSATRLGTATFSGARFVGADDVNLYLVWTVDQPVGAVFGRVSETSGAEDTAATLTGVATPFYPQLSGDSIFFVTSSTGATITTSTYGFPKNGANVTPTMLWTADVASDTCRLAIGGLTATPTKLVCGLFGVESHARTGGPAAVVVPKDLTQRANEVVASDGENVYLMTAPQMNGVSSVVGSLQRVASSGAAITPIACDVHTIENHMADGTFPIQNEYEVVVGGDQLYWIEKNQATSGTRWAIRHAAK